MGRLSPEQVAAWVRSSCDAQGVEVKVTDPVVLTRVGVLMGEGPRVRTPAKRRRNPGLRSQPPHGPHPVGVELADRGRVHHGVVEDRSDDRSLPVEVERRPLGA